MDRVLFLGAGVLAVAFGPALPPAAGRQHGAPAAPLVAPRAPITSTESSAPGEGAPSDPAHEAASTPAVARLGAAVRARTRAGTVYLPRGWPADGRAFDLVVHFHGAPPLVEAAVDEASLSAAVLMVNVGVGSAAYDRAYAGRGALDAALDAVRRVAARVAPGEPRVRRVALSAWSAGYGAVARVLGRRSEANIDAVLLADGLHTGFVAGRAVDPRRMAPFVELATEAARGGPLFALTHSAIRTIDFASTTQTTDFLLGAVGARRLPAHADVGGMTLASRADRGDLHVLGFEGEDARAHARQLRRMGTVLFPLLAARWSEGTTER